VGRDTAASRALTCRPAVTAGSGWLKKSENILSELVKMERAPQLALVLVMGMRSCVCSLTIMAAFSGDCTSSSCRARRGGF
jgi:hypothetical protein